MKRIRFIIPVLLLGLSGTCVPAYAPSLTAYASETAAQNQPEENAGESSSDNGTFDEETAETELVPQLLDTDKVSTDDILLYSSACVVMDTQNNAILYSKNRSDRHYPASTTKILTTLLALERTDLSDTITFSEEAVNSINWWDSSNMELEPGDQLTVEQTLYGVMLQSANEAAYGLAEYVSGSVDAFAQGMTDYAISLGCRMTHFTNASGLHDDNHYTTAKDLALIASAAAQNEDFRTITGTINYSVENINYKAMTPETEESQEGDHSTGNEAASESTQTTPELVPEPFPLYNHHKMVNNEYPYEGCYGGKTGYTEEARNTLVTYARRGDIDLVCVVMDCPGGGNYIYDDTALALDYCFENYERLLEEYNEAQALLDYPDMALMDWYHPEITPLSAKEGYYPYLKESMAVYTQYLENQASQEALDEAFEDKSLEAFMEYSRMNQYRPLIIVCVILFVVLVALSLVLIYIARRFKRRRRRRRYEAMKRQRLTENQKEADSQKENEP